MEGGGGPQVRQQRYWQDFNWGQAINSDFIATFSMRPLYYVRKNPNLRKVAPIARKVM